MKLILRYFIIFTLIFVASVSFIKTNEFKELTNDQKNIIDGFLEMDKTEQSKYEYNFIAGNNNLLILEMNESMFFMLMVIMAAFIIIFTYITTFGV